jgi:hypothetical protein
MGDSAMVEQGHIVSIGIVSITMVSRGQRGKVNHSRLGARWWLGQTGVPAYWMTLAPPLAAHMSVMSKVLLVMKSRLLSTRILSCQL